MDRGLRQAEPGIITEEVYVPLQILLLLLHRGKQLKRGARVVDCSVGVLRLELIRVDGVAELMGKRAAVLVNRERI